MSTSWKRPEVSGGIETYVCPERPGRKENVGKDLKSAVGLRPVVTHRDDVVRIGVGKDLKSAVGLRLRDGAKYGV